MDSSTFQHGPDNYEVSVDLGDNVTIVHIGLNSHKTVVSGATYDGEVIHDAPAHVDDTILDAAQRALNATR